MDLGWGDVLHVRPVTKTDANDYQLMMVCLSSLMALVGAGFSGFWYHLGLLRAVPLPHGYDYYCYSSGCLSVVLALLEAPVEETYNVCRGIQVEWSQGKLSTYDILDAFLDRLLPLEEETFTELLPRLNIISTRLDSTEVHIQQPSSRSELVSLLLRTTRIPFLTGHGWLQDGNARYIDGGFSRMFHPHCRYTVHVPVPWSTYIHSLNPGVSKEKVFEFVQLGLETSLT